MLLMLLIVSARAVLLAAFCYSQGQNANKLSLQFDQSPCLNDERFAMLLLVVFCPCRAIWTNSFQVPYKSSGKSPFDRMYSRLFKSLEDKRT